MTVDTLTNPGSSLGELVAERPVRAQLFEQLRLDYCCGGADPGRGLRQARARA